MDGQHLPGSSWHPCARAVSRRARDVTSKQRRPFGVNNCVCLDWYFEDSAGAVLIRWRVLFRFDARIGIGDAARRLYCGAVVFSDCLSKRMSAATRRIFAS
jgi:hypothetical protein